MFWPKRVTAKTLEEKVEDFFAYAREIGLLVNEWVFLGMGEDKRGFHIQIYARKHSDDDPLAWIERVRTKLVVISEVSISLKGHDIDGDYRFIELVFKGQEATHFVNYIEKAIHKFQTLSIEV